LVLAGWANSTNACIFPVDRAVHEMTRQTDVTESPPGVGLVLSHRALATVLGIRGGGVLVRRTRAAFPDCNSGAFVCYPLAWDAQRLLQALILPLICLKLVLRAWLLITIDAKETAAAVRGFQLAADVAVQSRIVVHQPWNQDSR
jgi:hypothetical protein